MTSQKKILNTAFESIKTYSNDVSMKKIYDAVADIVTAVASDAKTPTVREFKNKLLTESANLQEAEKLLQMTGKTSAQFYGLDEQQGQ